MINTEGRKFGAWKSAGGPVCPLGQPIFSSGSKAPRIPPQSVHPIPHPPRKPCHLLSCVNAPRDSRCLCCFLTWRGRMLMVPFSYSCGGGLKGFMMESTQYLALSTQHSTDVAYSHFCKCYCPWGSWKPNWRGCLLTRSTGWSVFPEIHSHSRTLAVLNRTMQERVLHP